MEDALAEILSQHQRRKLAEILLEVVRASGYGTVEIIIENGKPRKIAVKKTFIYQPGN
jgi:hypothetical protein